MSVQQLTAGHFMIAGNQRKALHIKLPGFVFVMFKMPTCPGCASVAPVMAQLAIEDRRITFATVDVSVYKDVLKMARQTVTPINAVPTLFLYAHGRPVARVKQKKDIASLRAFLESAIKTESTKAPPPQQSSTHEPYRQQEAPGSKGFVSGRHFRSQPVTGKVYVPENYKDLGAIQCSGDECMLIPEAIIPHNKAYLSMAVMDD